MHTYMIDKWNKHVSKNDIVYIVGDFSFGTFVQSKSIMDQLSGNKILIRGNHDRKSKRHLTTRDYLDMGFRDVMDEEVIKLSNNVPVLLKHYPYESNWFKMGWLKASKRLGPWKTYYAFYPVDKGLWHIHGHHHGGPRIKGRQINVNVESWDYRPIAESEICAMINNAEKNKLTNRLKYIINYVKGMATKLFQRKT